MPSTLERSACPRVARTACLGLGVCERSEHRPARASGPRRDFVDAYGQAAGRAFGSTRTALQRISHGERHTRPKNLL